MREFQAIMELKLTVSKPRAIEKRELRTDIDFEIQRRLTTHLR